MVDKIWGRCCCDSGKLESDLGRWRVVLSKEGGLLEARVVVVEAQSEKRKWLEVDQINLGEVWLVGRCRGKLHQWRQWGAT